MGLKSSLKHPTTVNRQYPDCDTAHRVRSYHWEKRKCISDKGLSESNQSFPPNLNIRVKQPQTHSQFLEESTARTRTHGHTKVQTLVSNGSRRELPIKSACPLTHLLHFNRGVVGTPASLSPWRLASSPWGLVFLFGWGPFQSMVHRILPQYPFPQRNQLQVSGSPARHHTFVNPLVKTRPWVSCSLGANTRTRLPAEACSLP